MTMPANSLPEIMRRTMDNLEIVRKVRKERQGEGIAVDDVGPYEVTQLVNSVLGALVHPWEAMLKKKDATRFPELDALSQHLAGIWYGPGEEPDLIQRLGYVRNAFAHANLEFIPGPRTKNGQRDITGVRIWNCTMAKRKNWEIELRVEDLSNLLDDFVRIARQLYDPGLMGRDRDCENDPAD